MDSLIAQLHKFTPGELPLEVFNEVAHLVVTPVIELVIYRTSIDGGVEVLLSQRPHDDPFWPDKYHLPGMTVTAKNIDQQPDELARQLFSRFVDKVSGDIIFVTTLAVSTERGPELAIIFKIDVSDQTILNQHFYSTIKLPSPLISSHADILNAALKS